MNGNGHAVRLEHVSKTFRDRAILKDVSFAVERGEAFCILGRSGSGKSVTLKLMIGLIKPDRGRILIGDKDIPALDARELSAVRKRMGFLFQDAALFDSITVAENVAFPVRRHLQKQEEEIQQIIRQKLKDVDLEGQGKKMPSELSGGMRKRAALARALALDPDILLVDEPSSGLDRITAAEIDDLLRALKEQRKATLVVVTHDVAGARKFADRFAVLNGGRIVACGGTDDLAASKDEIVRQLTSATES